MEADGTGGSGGKLVTGVRIALFDPKWDRSCRDCMAHIYNRDGTVRRLPDGALIPRTSEPAPCVSCAKVPNWAKGDARRDWREMQKHAVDMTEENRKAFERWNEWRATNSFPDDPIVQWYSGLIQRVYDEWHRAPAVASAKATTELIQLLRAKK